MKPWEKYAEIEAKPWEKYGLEQSQEDSVDTTPRVKGYDEILAQAPSIDARSIGKLNDFVENLPINDKTLGRIGVADRGMTFGLGRKAGGLINAVGAYPVDRIAQLSGVENTPSFWDRYHETVDPTMQAMDRYQEERPVEAFALEMAGGIANPANKVGAGWIGKGGNAATRVLRSGVVGTGAGGVAGAMNTENVENLRDNTIVGSVLGFGLGVSLPVVIGMITKGIGMMRNNTKKGLDYMRRELGDEAVNAMIREAEETGRPIIEVANDKALKLGQAARMQTPEAMDTIDAAAERFKNTATDRNSSFIDDNLGSLSRFDSIEALEKDAKEQAAPLWDKFYQRGDLAEVEAKNLAAREQSKQNLINQLNSGEYSDIPFGALPENIRQQVNQIRVNNGEIPLDADMIIPAGVVKKWRGNRMLENYTPERIAQIADEVYHLSDVNVSESKYPHIQKLLRERDGHNNDFIGFVSRNDKTGDTVAKTVYQKPRRGSAERQSASLQDNPAGRKRLSDLQASSMDNNIPSLATYVKENPFLQQEIGKIRKNPLFQTEYKMSELPDTDARILDQLNKNINDQISTAIRNGEKETVRLLERQKHGLLNMVDDIAPEFKEARALYEDVRRFKDAANMADQIFKGDISKEAFAKTFDKMSKTEKEALKIGLREEIYKIIGNRENEALGWKKIVPAQVQEKIRKVLGADEGNKLIKYANDEIKAMRNYNKATQGSKTAEKTDLEKAINWRRELLDFASLGSVSGRNKGIANIMTNPNAGEVASAFEQLSNPKWGEAVYQRYLGYTPEMIALGNYLANKR